MSSRATSRGFAVVLALLVGQGIAVAGDDSARMPSLTDFAYGMKFEVTGSAAAFRSALPLDVYRGVVRPDLGDIAVFNSTGEVVPHVLEVPRTESMEKQPPVSFPVFPLRGNELATLEALRVTIETGGSKVDVRVPGTAAAERSSPAAITGYVLDGRVLTSAISGMQIGWPDDAPEFAGRLRVEASDDLGYWQTLVDAAPIANLRAGDARLIERRIETRPMRSKYWRLSWVGENAPFEITSVTAEPAGDREDVGRPSLAIEGVPVAGKPGEFEFDIGAHLPVDRLNLALPELNSVVEVQFLSRATPKQAWGPVTRNGFYRLQSASTELVNGEVSIAPNSDRYWMARVDMRANGLGSGKPKLQVAWPPHEIVFLARGAGPYTLAFGNASITTPAGRMPSLPKGAHVLYAQLGERETQGGEARRTAAATEPFPAKSTILWTVLGLGVALLAYMAYRLSRELKR
jgi:hypothetical protein